MNTGNFIIVSENCDATHKWGSMIAAIFIAVCFCFVVNYFFIT